MLENRLSKNLILLATLSLLQTACVVPSSLYEPKLLKGGKFGGEVELRWENTTRFVYLPVAENRLTYVFPANYKISNNESINANPDIRTITPALMYTDGGSIPRPFWGVSGLSPFDYLPAYVIHDWMYLQKRCHNVKKGAFAAYADFPYQRKDIDLVLADSLEQLDKQLIKNGAVRPKNAAQARALIVKAVEDFGKEAWNGKDCVLPPALLTKQVLVKQTQTIRTFEAGRMTERSIVRTRTTSVPRYTLIKRYSVE